MEWGGVNWLVIRGVLDVLVVYYLIYKSLLLVRGTRAEYVLKGLAIVVIVYVASRYAGLVTLNWILGNFLGSVILVVVVLFQDDLRRGLIKVGLIPGIGAEISQALDASLKEISRAAMELSSRRLGALLVVQRDVGLEDYTEHAVSINAVVSQQLLVSIFLPNSPLHDGAVIISSDQILVAGAVLPLSFGPAVSSSLGTRHRAAIGLSERTDALVVVVSEETGTVSLVREGKLVRGLDEHSLYAEMRRHTVDRLLRRRPPPLTKRMLAIPLEEVKPVNPDNTEDKKKPDGVPAPDEEQAQGEG